MSVIRPIIRNIRSPLAKSISAAIARYMPSFNGPSQYGVLSADWTPTGATWSIAGSFTLDAITASNQAIVGDADGGSLTVFVDSAGRLITQIKDASGTDRYPNAKIANIITEGKGNTFLLQVTPNSATLTMNGITGTPQSHDFSDLSKYKIHYAARFGGGLHFGGDIHSLKFINSNDANNTRNYLCDEAGGDRLHDSYDTTRSNNDIILIGGVERVIA